MSHEPVNARHRKAGFVSPLRLLRAIKRRVMPPRQETNQPGGRLPSWIDAAEALGPAPELVHAYYEELTPLYERGFGETFQASRPQDESDLHDYIAAGACLGDGLRVLDAGCGIAGPAIALARRFDVTIEGLTTSATQIKRAQARVSDAGLTAKIKLREGDFHQLAASYPASSFDRVLFLESLCHAHDYRSVLAGAFAVLKPGGLVYIKDFHAVDHRRDAARLSLQRDDLESVGNTYRLRFPELSSIVSVLGMVGFQLVSVHAPRFEQSMEKWLSYEAISPQPWTAKCGDGWQVFRPVELLFRKP